MIQLAQINADQHKFYINIINLVNFLSHNNCDTREIFVKHCTFLQESTQKDMKWIQTKACNNLGTPRTRERNIIRKISDRPTLSKIQLLVKLAI